MKIVVCISGASGAGLGLKLYNNIDETHQKYLIVSDNAKTVLLEEELISYDDSNIAAPPASGSFGVDTTIIFPCSMNTLAKISVGIADNLVTRVAQVALKERRKLIISPREIPFSTIHLEHMAKLSSMGVIVAPPIIGYYSKSESIADMENFIVGRILDFAGIENKLYKKWRDGE